MDLRIGLYKTYNDKIVNITEGTDMNKLYKFQGTIDGKDSAAYQWSHQGYDRSFKCIEQCSYIDSIKRRCYWMKCFVTPYQVTFCWK